MKLAPLFLLLVLASASSCASDAQANNTPRLSGLTANFMVQKKKLTEIDYFSSFQRLASKTFPDDSQR